MGSGPGQSAQGGQPASNPGDSFYQQPASQQPASDGWVPTAGPELMPGRPATAAAPSNPLAAISTENSAAPASAPSYPTAPIPTGTSGVPFYQNYGPSPTPTGTPSGTSFGTLQGQAAQGYNQLLGPNNQNGLSGYTDAAIQNYERNILPRIQNQYATIGLGSSPAMADAVTAGYYSALPDIYQYQQQGQLGASQGLGNLAGTTSQHGLGLTGLQNQALANQANYQLGIANTLNARDQTELARQQQAFNNYMTAGNQNYNWMQSRNDAIYNDMLRRMGLSQFQISGGFGTPIGSQTSGTQRSGK